MKAWFSVFNMMLPFFLMLLCGDFNAHQISWGYSRSSSRGGVLYETSLKYDLVSLNDSQPTYVPLPEVPPSNIDLIFCLPSVSHLSVFFFGEEEKWHNHS